MLPIFTILKKFVKIKIIMQKLTSIHCILTCFCFNINKCVSFTQFTAQRSRNDGDGKGQKGATTSEDKRLEMQPVQHQNAGGSSQQGHSSKPHKGFMFRSKSEFSRETIEEINRKKTLMKNVLKSRSAARRTKKAPRRNIRVRGMLCVYQFRGLTVYSAIFLLNYYFGYYIDST